MMQPAGLRDGKHVPSVGRFYFTRQRRIAIERHVRSRVVVVVKVLAHDAFQVPLAEHDDMIDTFSAY